MTAPILSAVPSRITGVAPLAIFLDCTATAGVDMHTGLFFHCFGDDSSQTWDYGSNTSRSKNFATGIVAAHVYETPGTYTITTVVSNNLGETDEVTNTITVIDSNVQWSTTKTICVSASGDFTGAPAGSILVTNSNAATAVSANIGSGNVRILFKRGETFTAATSCILNQPGPGMIGSFGSGAKPIIQATTNNTDYGCFSVTGNVEDWRIVDLNLIAPVLAANKTVGVRGNGLMNKLTVLRTDISGTYSGITLPESALAAPGVWTDLAVVDCTIRNLTGGAGGNGSYIDVKNLMWMGNDIDDTTGIEHGLRVASCVKGVITNSNFSRAATGKVVLTIRAPLFAGTTPIPAGTYTEYIIVSDNIFTPSTTQVGNVGIGPLGNSYDGRLRNLLFERNFFDYATSGSMQIQMSLTASNVTIRNNIMRTRGQPTDSRLFQIEMANTSVGYPVPNDIKYINNTGYSEDTGTNVVFLYQITTTGTPTNVVAMNNLFYAPNSTSRLFNQGGSVTLTTNTGAVGSALTSPQFIGPTTLPRGFIISNTSYAVDGGSTQFPAQHGDFLTSFDKFNENRIGAMVQAGQALLRSVAA